MKKKVLLILLSLFCLSSGIIVAQFQSFDLSTYKNPFYKRQQLDLNLNMNGANASNESTNISFPYKNTNSNFSGNFNGTYLNILNSDRIQRFWQISISETPYFTRQRNNSSYNYVSNINRNNFGLDVKSSDRIYRSNKQFIEVNFTANVFNNIDNGEIRNYYQYNDSLTTQETKYNRTILMGSVGLRYGKGRIEYVQDARLAVYLLDDLSKHNRLSRNPTNEELIKFAEIITQIKNKRFFDSRIRKIAEITAIDSFLQTNHFISKNDATYYTSINDNWDNAAGPAREAGFRYSLGVTPNINWAIEHDRFAFHGEPTVYNDINNHSLGIAGDLLFNDSKPLNLYWQADFGMDLTYSFSKEINKNSSLSNRNLNQFSANLYAKLGYYPNSRSYYSTSLSLVGTEVFSKMLTPPVGIKDKNRIYSISPNFSLNGYFYISQQLRLRGTYSLYYLKSSIEDIFANYDRYNNKYFQQSFTIAITYSLF